MTFEYWQIRWENYGTKGRSLSLRFWQSMVPDGSVMSQEMSGIGHIRLLPALTNHKGWSIDFKLDSQSDNCLLSILTTICLLPMTVGLVLVYQHMSWVSIHGKNFTSQIFLKPKWYNSYICFSKNWDVICLWYDEFWFAQSLNKWTWWMHWCIGPSDKSLSAFEKYKNVCVV